MGTQASGLFADDLAMDVRDAFRQLLAEGLDAAAVTAQLKADWARALEDPEEGSVFRLALAATQWSCGCLLDDVLQEALQEIDSGRDLERWQGAALKRRRAAVLQALRERLVSPQPKPKRPRRRALPKLAFKECASPDGSAVARASEWSNRIGAPPTWAELSVAVGGTGSGLGVVECDYRSVEFEWRGSDALCVRVPAGAVPWTFAERVQLGARVIALACIAKPGP